MSVSITKGSKILTKDAVQVNGDQALDIQTSEQRLLVRGVADRGEGFLSPTGGVIPASFCTGCEFRVQFRLLGIRVVGREV